ncbi:hypothetical protein BC628DRAFT_1322350 [Trametes gibbosa]|nr:hypothetical protein BC628DRAFT_1322350 [Trametes gibbosa]
MDVNDSTTGPPWYTYGPDGHLDFDAIPVRLQTHPEIQKRGIVLLNGNKPGVVYSTSTQAKPPYVVKILDTATEERAIYERLLREPHSANHTIPGELTQNGYPLIIMPYLGSYYNAYYSDAEWSSLHRTLSLFLQLVEGVEYLHDRNIVHMDLCFGNTLASSHPDEVYHPELVRDRLYIIDFDSARQFADGPGVQRAIKLPPTQIRPPNGLTYFDPYSWDVHCLSTVLEAIMQSNYSRRTHAAPWIARWYVQWLRGVERGCHTVCRCRPTARRARLVLTVIRSVVYVLQFGASLPKFAEQVLRVL